MLRETHAGPFKPSDRRSAPRARHGGRETIADARSLDEHRVGYGSVASHLPRLNGIEMNGARTFGLRPVLDWDIPVLAQLRHRRLNITGFIRAARLKDGLLSVPSPVVSKSCMGLRMHGPLNLRV